MEQFLNIDQFGIHIGQLTQPDGWQLYLRFYGFILVSGAFLGGYLAALEAQRRGQNPDHVWDGLIWALIGGIVGARIWHVLTPPPSMVEAGITTAYYLSHPLEAIAVWKGGLGIPGAVMGGVVALFFYTRALKLDFTLWLDLVAPALALGQAIGRWGNYVNMELYGGVTTLPWGILTNPFDPVRQTLELTDPELRFHPTFLYESIGNFLICLFLLYLSRRRADWLKRGDLFLFYLILYPALRFVLEFLRLDSSQVLGLNANQTLMVILVVGALAALSVRHQRQRKYERIEPAEAK